MPTRGPLGRSLLGLGLVCGGLLAVAGGLMLRGPGLVAVAVAGGVSAALAAGVVRENAVAARKSVAEIAWQAAAWTVGVLLVVSGIAAVAGGVVAALVTAGALLAGLAVVLVRMQRRRGGGAAPTTAVGSWPPPTSASRTAGAVARALPPVAALPTSALGREWLRSTTALTTRLQPAARAALVRRRQETLDELERRDPEGFARWLAAGPAPGSDPAAFVHGDVRDVRGDQAAGTDAA